MLTSAHAFSVGREVDGAMTRFPVTWSSQTFVLARILMETGRVLSRPKQA